MQRPELAGTWMRQASSNFQIGMAARVAERLTSLHAEREASVAAQWPTGTALVLVRHQVVKEAFKASRPAGLKNQISAIFAPEFPQPVKRHRA